MGEKNVALRLAPACKADRRALPRSRSALEPSIASRSAPSRTSPVLSSVDPGRIEVTTMLTPFLTGVC